MSILTGILFVYSIAIVASLVFRKLKLPNITGFIVGGCLVGPYGLGIIPSREDVELLSEIGVVLIMFSVGLECSLSELNRMKRVALVGGAIQIILTIFFAFLIIFGLGVQSKNAIMFGILISLSSTAIVMKILQERMEIDTSHGQVSTGILIFQDIAVLPIMIFVPFLAGRGDMTPTTWIAFFFKACALLGFVIIGSRFIFPRLLSMVASARSKEIFLLTVVVMCFGVSLGAFYMGLSLALGAFIAGLMLSETPFRHQTFASIVPLRDLFSGLFFVSVGMLFDPGFIFHNLLPIIALTFFILVLKFITAGLAIICVGYPIRVATHVGVILCHVGEFSIMLGMFARELGVLGERGLLLFYSAATLTMFVAPLLISAAPTISEFISSRAGRLTSWGTVSCHYGKTSPKKPENHMIIIGFGPVGRYLADVAKIADIPYCVIEMNPVTVMAESRKGENIMFGDATQESILQEANLEAARVVVVSFSDSRTSRNVVENVRSLSKRVYLIARTRFISEIDTLKRLGADEVICEELETSIELFSRSVSQYLVPAEDIAKFIDKIRRKWAYLTSDSNLANLETDLSRSIRTFLDIELRVWRISAQSKAMGKTLAELNVRSIFGVTVLAIRRSGAIIANPKPEERLLEGDYIIVIGSSESLTRADMIFGVQE